MGVKQGLANFEPKTCLGALLGAKHGPEGLLSTKQKPCLALSKPSWQCYASFWLKIASNLLGIKQIMLKIGLKIFGIQQILLKIGFKKNFHEKDLLNYTQKFA